MSLNLAAESWKHNNFEGWGESFVRSNDTVSSEREGSATILCDT